MVSVRDRLHLRVFSTVSIVMLRERRYVYDEPVHGRSAGEREDLHFYIVDPPSRGG